MSLAQRTINQSKNRDVHHLETGSVPIHPGLVAVLSVTRKFRSIVRARYPLGLIGIVYIWASSLWSNNY